MLIRIKIYFVVLLTVSSPIQAFSQSELPVLNNRNIADSTKVQRTKHYAEVLLDQARYLLNNEQYDKALFVYKAAYPFALFYRQELVNVYGNMAICYGNMGSYRESIEMWNQALGCIRGEGLERKRAIIHRYMANDYFGIRDYRKAAKYNDSALAVLWHSQRNHDKVMAMALKANILSAQNAPYNNIITAYRDVYDMVDTLEPSLSVIEIKYLALANIGNVYIDKKMPDSCLFYLKQINPAYLPKLRQGKLNQPYVYTGIMLLHGEAYAQKGEYGEALRYLTDALKVAEERDYKQYIKTVYNRLAEVYSGEGDFKKAFKHLQLNLSITDSIFKRNEENIHKVNAVESEYLVAKKNLEISNQQLLLAQQQNALQQKNHVQVLLALGACSLAVVLLIYIRSARHKHQLLKAQLSNIKKSQRIAQIEATMQGEEMERERIAKELHDGVVSEVMALTVNLQTVGRTFPMLTSSDDYRTLMYQSESIAHKLRETAHNLMPNHSNNMGLMDSIKSFVERINSHKLHFTFQHLGTIPRLYPEVEKIILFSVLELIQNIIKHANATDAIIQVNCYDETLSITIEDNGVGISGQQQYGMGLTNLIKNMEMLEANLDIQGSEFSGTTILIEIPLHGRGVETKKERVTDNN